MLDLPRKHLEAGGENCCDAICRVSRVTLNVSVVAAITDVAATWKSARADSASPTSSSPGTPRCPMRSKTTANGTEATALSSGQRHSGDRECSAVGAGRARRRISRRYPERERDTAPCIQAAQVSSSPVPCIRSVPGKTRKRTGSRRRMPNLSESGPSQPGIIAGS
jgi:hypothetical protein